MFSVQRFILDIYPKYSEDVEGRENTLDDTITLGYITVRLSKHVE